jgi:hypothetical protein
MVRKALPCPISNPAPVGLAKARSRSGSREPWRPWDVTQGGAGSRNSCKSSCVAFRVSCSADVWGIKRSAAVHAIYDNRHWSA